jgi:ribosomal protein S18 acetylase RimI-like enzyme
VRLRPATDADDDFCFRLNLATMRDYVEPIYGWDVDVQRRYHDEWFEADRLSIIEDDDGTAIGVLDVSDEGGHLYLSRIEVLPEVQGRGVGTAVMEGLIRQGRAIRLHVFTNNIRARASTRGSDSSSTATRRMSITSRCIALPSHPRERESPS